MTETSLLEALGFPNLELLPPSASAAEWSFRRNSLRAHLRALGCTTSLRTPAALWAAAGIQGRPGRRWCQLADLSLPNLAARLQRPRGTTAVQIASWNARWLLSPHSGQGTRKRAFIQELWIYRWQIGFPTPYV